MEKLFSTKQKTTQLAQNAHKYTTLEIYPQTQTQTRPFLTTTTTMTLTLSSSGTLFFRCCFFLRDFGFSKISKNEPVPFRFLFRFKFLASKLPSQKKKNHHKTTKKQSMTMMMMMQAQQQYHNQRFARARARSDEKNAVRRCVSLMKSLFFSLSLVVSFFFFSSIKLCL